MTISLTLKKASTEMSNPYCNEADNARLAKPVGDSIDVFFASVECRALRMAQFATRQSPDAFDLVQEAMIKLIEVYGDRPVEECRILFFKILHNRILDWHRRNKVRSRFRLWFFQDLESEIDPLEQIPDTAVRDGETQLTLDLTIEALNRAVEALPLRQQQAFLLRAWEGLNVRDTAVAMGCSEGSIKTHYSRAVHSLRKSLAQHYNIESDSDDQ
jgi:RNA polymerase sigma-70 factor (ECF subfamily)